MEILDLPMIIMALLYRIMVVYHDLHLPLKDFDSELAGEMLISLLILMEISVHELLYHEQNSKSLDK